MRQFSLFKWHECICIMLEGGWEHVSEWEPMPAWHHMACIASTAHPVCVATCRVRGPLYI